MGFKNIHNLKVDSYALFGGDFSGFKAKETASQVNLRELFPGGRGEEPGYRSFATKGR